VSSGDDAHAAASLARWIVLALAAAYALLAALLGRRIVRLRSEVRASAAWLPARARVVSAEKRIGFKGQSHVDLAYEYEADGARHRGTRLHLGEPSAYSFERGADAVLARCPVGGEVEVFFDPADPGRSVLERRAPVLVRDAILLAIVTAVLAGLVAGLFALVRLPATA
jgi:hypothetical protein